MNPSTPTDGQPKPIPERLGQLIGRVRAKQLKLARLGKAQDSARYAKRAKRLGRFGSAAA
ncbi:MAG: hypothetical protein AAGH99_03500 [Planctomycetota bacterium]